MDKCGHPIIGAEIVEKELLIGRFLTSMGDSSFKYPEREQF